MELNPQVSQLLIYPIKSLDGVEVKSATVLPSGALQGDREFALVDELGRFVNGKRCQQVHLLRTQFDQVAGKVAIAAPGQSQPTQFHLTQQQMAVERWLSDYFGFPVRLQQDREQGFPDDTVSPGPTIISTATLAAIAAWYPGLTVDQVRRRFRSNIEVSGVPAFWEDRLFSETGVPVRFQVGDVQLLGINPCQRCVVITRNPDTGAATPHFQKEFVARRQEKLPDWAPRSRFNHFFRLAVNTQVPSSEAGKTIQIGDTVQVHPA